MTQEQAEKAHDENLHNFLLRMQQVLLKLNLPKYRFKTPTVIFTGFQLNPDGVSSGPTMVEVILSMPNAEFPCRVLSILE